ncbi:MAG: low molecular weight phosphotyrosine protein phosphatase [Deltaproteobacteria bacterium]|nr:low molecular weight phosphotyrosine protein phosphatase [Deltaproteobacteria bacterium]MBW2405400.1 low molecular weight phosphotyrosine protein phosphatase [Deltaproteobacteria bacterium]MBW2546914.1 low molecular weight phosphotyrosine protein phosphatase [Deltaproteobacteria bacterium]
MVMPVRVCFICLGNICRSPTAEATMRRLLEEEQLTAHIEIDSAGTGDWHVGEPPDRRATAAAKRRGIEMGGRARRVVAKDFERFDYVIAMDRANRSDLLRLAPSPAGKAKVELFRNYDPVSPRDAEVPDPYYGQGDGFETVLDICEAASRGLLRDIRDNHSL